jgi:GTP-binding protein
MNISSARFLVSSAKISQLPPPELPEYAFIGRSNVGKSSVINLICDRYSLALTSGKPGKTRLINHFIINENWYLVDLPGTGYAKVSETMRKAMLKTTIDYFESRENLMTVFLLMDIRHVPLEDDMKFCILLAELGLPFSIILTKADKLSTQSAQKQVQLLTKRLADDWEELPNIFVTSAFSRKGREEILRYIAECNLLFQPNQ